jgi:hypothetical protein
LTTVDKIEILKAMDPNNQQTQAPQSPVTNLPAQNTPPVAIKKSKLPVILIVLGIIGIIISIFFGGGTLLALKEFNTTAASLNISSHFNFIFFILSFFIIIIFNIGETVFGYILKRKQNKNLSITSLDKIISFIFILIPIIIFFATIPQFETSVLKQIKNTESNITSSSAQSTIHQVPSAIPTPNPTVNWKIYGGQGYSFIYNPNLALWLNPSQPSVWDYEYSKIPQKEQLLVQSSPIPFSDIKNNDRVPLISSSSALIVTSSKTETIDGKNINEYLVSCGDKTCSKGIARFFQDGIYTEIILDTSSDATNFTNTVKSLRFLSDNKSFSGWRIIRDRNVLFALPANYGPELDQPTEKRWTNPAFPNIGDSIFLDIQTYPFPDPTQDITTGKDTIISQKSVSIVNNLPITRFQEDINEQNCIGCHKQVVQFIINKNYYQLAFDLEDKEVTAQIDTILSTLRPLVSLNSDQTKK